MMHKYQKLKKTDFTTSDYNKFMSNTFDVKVIQKKVN